MTCRDCGAEVSTSNTSKHRSWHSDLDRKLRDLQSRANRAVRDSRNRADGGF